MLRNILVGFVAVFSVTACSAEPGSKAWCKNMDEKPAGEWTTNEATEYAKSCIFQDDD
jgi:hypothetical protein